MKRAGRPPATYTIPSLFYKRDAGMSRVNPKEIVQFAYTHHAEAEACTIHPPHLGGTSVYSYRILQILAKTLVL